MSTNGKTRTTGRAVAKTTEETTVEVGTLVPQAHGGALRYGGTNKGGPGRPPNAFKAQMEALLDTQRKTKSGRSRKKADFAIDNYLRECLDGDHGPAAFFQAYDRVVDRAEGKVPNVTQVSGSEEPLTIILTHGRG